MMNIRIAEVSTHTGAGASGSIQVICGDSVKIYNCELHDSNGHISIDGTPSFPSSAVSIVGGDCINIRLDHASDVIVSGTQVSAITTTANTISRAWTFRPGLLPVGYSSGSPTANVSGLAYLFISNSQPITITNFAGGQPGQVLTLIFNDVNTTIDRHQGPFVLANSTNFVGAQFATLTLVRGPTYWHEVSRSFNG
jgi:hypothetical protein